MRFCCAKLLSLGIIYYLIVENEYTLWDYSPWSHSPIPAPMTWESLHCPSRSWVPLTGLKLPLVSFKAHLWFCSEIWKCSCFTHDGHTPLSPHSTRQAADIRTLFSVFPCSLLPECLQLWLPFCMHFTFCSFTEPKLPSWILGTHFGHKPTNEGKKKKDPCPPGTCIEETDGVQ